MRKILAFLLAVFMIMSLTSCKKNLSGMGGQSETNPTSVNNGDESLKGIPTLSIKKVGTFAKKNLQKGLNTANAFYYEENGKYGIVSSDGKNDTGAIYENVERNEEYFVALQNEIDISNDIDSVNSYALVDSNAKVVIPAQYAHYEKLSDRYYQVCKITGITTNKDEAIMYAYSGMLKKIFPDDDDTFLKGNWYIYDLKNGRLVKGVSGTKNYRIEIFGDIIKYINDNEKYCYVDETGNSVPKRSYFSNGAYIDGSTLYDCNGKELFSYYEDGYNPVRFELDDDCYIALKRYKDKTFYAVMNENGEIVSAEFEDITVYDSLIKNIKKDFKLYDFKGNLIFDEHASNVYNNPLLPEIYLIEGKEDKYTILSSDGEVYYQDTESDTISIDRSFLTTYKKADGDRLYYSFKDKDYTISATETVTYWTVEKRKSDGSHELINVITGEALLSGYADYNSVKATDGTIYIYAKLTNGTYDIYKLEA